MRREHGGLRVCAADFWNGVRTGHGHCLVFTIIAMTRRAIEFSSYKRQLIPKLLSSHPFEKAAVSLLAMPRVYIVAMTRRASELSSYKRH